MTLEAALKLALTLPNVERGTAHGVPAVKTGGKKFACQTSHKSAEPNTLAVRLDFESRDALIAEAPETYYLKEHYVNYPIVLVRLGKIHRDAMKNLLIQAHRFVSASGAPRRRNFAGRRA